MRTKGRKRGSRKTKSSSADLPYRKSPMIGTKKKIGREKRKPQHWQATRQQGATKESVEGRVFPLKT